MSTSVAASYMQAWLNQDEALFLSLLAPDVLVVESYGPVYRGHAECAAWFRGWHGAPAFGRVIKWELGRSYFDATRSAVFCEWDFECLYEGKSGGFLGSSLYLLRDGLIAELHEYKTEREQYRPYKATSETH